MKKYFIIVLIIFGYLSPIQAFWIVTSGTGNTKKAAVTHAKKMAISKVISKFIADPIDKSVAAEVTKSGISYLKVIKSIKGTRIKKVQGKYRAKMRCFFSRTRLYEVLTELESLETLIEEQPILLIRSKPSENWLEDIVVKSANYVQESLENGPYSVKENRAANHKLYKQIFATKKVKIDKKINARLAVGVNIAVKETIPPAFSHQAESYKVIVQIKVYDLIYKKQLNKLTIETPSSILIEDPLDKESKLTSAALGLTKKIVPLLGSKLLYQLTKVPKNDQYQISFRKFSKIDLIRAKNVLTKLPGVYYQFLGQQTATHLEYSIYSKKPYLLDEVYAKLHSAGIYLKVLKFNNHHISFGAK